MAVREEFPAIARRFRAGDASGHEVTEAFEKSTFFFVMHDEPGFEAMGAPDDGFVPLYSSEDALIGGEGPRRWMAARGRDVVQVIPAGYGIAIDPGSDSQLLLPARAIRSPQSGAIELNGDQ